MHQQLVARLGVPLGELWNIEGLVEHSPVDQALYFVHHREADRADGGMGWPSHAKSILSLPSLLGR